jgi:hypothetical protein
VIINGATTAVVMMVAAMTEEDVTINGATTAVVMMVAVMSEEGVISSEATTAVHSAGTTLPEVLLGAATRILVKSQAAERRKNKYRANKPKKKKKRSLLKSTQLREREKAHSTRKKRSVCFVTG